MTDKKQPTCSECPLFSDEAFYLCPRKKHPVLSMQSACEPRIRELAAIEKLQDLEEWAKSAREELEHTQDALTIALDDFKKAEAELDRLRDGLVGASSALTCIAEDLEAMICLDPLKNGMGIYEMAKQALSKVDELLTPEPDKGDFVIPTAVTVTKESGEKILDMIEDPPEPTEAMKVLLADKGDCPDCLGSGTIPGPIPDPTYRGGLHSESVTCPTCKGTGNKSKDKFGRSRSPYDLNDRKRKRR
jgi:hypothetical protein